MFRLLVVFKSVVKTWGTGYLNSVALYLHMILLYTFNTAHQIYAY